MTASATLADDELVRLARAGRRDAFAVLYHRYVQQVHDLVATGSPDGAAAESTTIAVFSDLLRHLPEVPPGGVPGMLEHHARRRIRGHAGGPHIPPLTVGTVDRMWREIDRRWPTGDPPPRDVGTMVPVTAGALVALLILGALASTSRRSGIPDPGRSFEAVSVQDGTDLAPVLPIQEVTAADEATPDPEATVALPTTEPTLAPSEPPSETATPVSPAPVEPTEEPDAAPEVTIRSPADGSTLRSDGADDGGSYATVQLDGLAIDDRDPPESLVLTWASDLDGTLAEGATGSARLYLPDGALTATHVITFTATDTAGNTNATSVTVVVTRV